MLALVAAGVESALRAILLLYAFAGTSGSLSYALLTPRFPPAMTGRVTTAFNMLMFAASFVLQWSIGAALKLYPGYTAAFTTIALLQLAALAWLLPMRAVEFGDGARTVSRIRP
jgi:hypothetical protein